MASEASVITPVATLSSSVMPAGAKSAATTSPSAEYAYTSIGSLAEPSKVVPGPNPERTSSIL